MALHNLWEVGIITPTQLLSPSGQTSNTLIPNLDLHNLLGSTFTNKHRRAVNLLTWCCHNGNISPYPRNDKQWHPYRPLPMPQRTIHPSTQAFLKENQAIPTMGPLDVMFKEGRQAQLKRRSSTHTPCEPLFMKRTKNEFEADLPSLPTSHSCSLCHSSLAGADHSLARCMYCRAQAVHIACTAQLEHRSWACQDCTRLPDKEARGWEALRTRYNEIKAGEQLF